MVAAGAETRAGVLLWLRHGGARRHPDYVEVLHEVGQADPDVRAVEQLLARAQPLPEWALAVDGLVGRPGVWACQAGWEDELERLVVMIGASVGPADFLPATSLSLEPCDPVKCGCGELSGRRRAWGLEVISRLEDYLAGVLSMARDPLHAALGWPTPDKLGAVRLLVGALSLVTSDDPSRFDVEYPKLPASTATAQAMRKPIAFVRFACAYRWERTIEELCRAIADPAFRDDPQRVWALCDPERHGGCDRQVALCVAEDGQRLQRVATVLLGTWSWLTGRPLPMEYADYLRRATRVRHALGEPSAVKRYLAGRVFVAAKAWLQFTDERSGLPVLRSYPALDAGVSAQGPSA